MAFIHSKQSTFTYNSQELSGVDSVQFSNSADPVDTTGIGDSAKSYISGIGDVSISVSGIWDNTDTTGSDDVMYAAFANGSAYAFIYKPDETATTGISYTGSGIVTQYDVSSSVGDKVTWSAEILVTTAVTRNDL